MSWWVHRQLDLLLALANRPGTEAEGRAARAAAERLATRAGMRLYEQDGVLVADEASRVDLLEALQAIADGPRPRPELGR